LNPTRGATPQTSVLSGQNKPKTTKPIDPNDKIAEKKN
jgi:hypothetical protein